MYVARLDETAIPDKIHMTGAKTSIKRTITPWIIITTFITERTSSLEKYFSSTYSIVDREDAVEDNEDIVVGEFGEAVVETGGEEEGEDLKIEVEGGPGSWLMLRNTAKVFFL